MIASQMELTQFHKFFGHQFESFCNDLKNQPSMKSLLKKLYIEHELNQMSHQKQEKASSQKVQIMKALLLDKKRKELEIKNYVKMSSQMEVYRDNSLQSGDNSSTKPNTTKTTEANKDKNQYLNLQSFNHSHSSFVQEVQHPKIPQGSYSNVDEHLTSQENLIHQKEDIPLHSSQSRNTEGYLESIDNIKLESQNQTLLEFQFSQDSQDFFQDIYQSEEEDSLHNESNKPKLNSLAKEVNPKTQQKKDNKNSINIHETQLKNLNNNRNKNTDLNRLSQENSAISDKNIQSKPRKQRKILTQETINCLKQIFQKEWETGEKQQNSSKLAKYFDIDRTVISKLRRDWRVDPNLMEAIKRVRFKGLGKRNDQECKKTAARKAVLIEILTKEPYLTQREMHMKLIEDPRLADFKQIVEKAVRKIITELRYSRKRIILNAKKRNNDAEVIDARFTYCKQYSHIRRKDAKGIVYFLDEEKFNINMKREYIWLRDGEKIPSEISNPTKNNVLVILMMGQRPEQIEWETRLESDFEAYLKVIRSFFRKITAKGDKGDKMKLNGRKKYLAIDAQKISNVMVMNKLKEALEPFDCEVLIIPKDSHQLNAVHYYCNNLKTLMKKKDFETTSEMQIAIGESIRETGPGYATSCFANVDNYAELGLKKTPF